MEKGIDKLLDLLNKDKLDAITDKCVKAACSNTGYKLSESSQKLVGEAVQLFLVELQKHVIIKPRRGNHGKSTKPECV